MKITIEIFDFVRLEHTGVRTFCINIGTCIFRAETTASEQRMIEPCKNLEYYRFIVPTDRYVEAVRFTKAIALARVPEPYIL